MTTKLKSADVEVGRNYWGNKMIWIGENITLSNLINQFVYLKENYGLTNSALAYSIGIAEGSLSRIFSKKHRANRSTLIALDVALNQWEEHLENEDDS